MIASEAHYIVFHPDYARQKVRVNATALISGSLNTSWRGEIYVDAIGKGMKILSYSMIHGYTLIVTPHS